MFGEMPTVHVCVSAVIAFVLFPIDQQVENDYRGKSSVDEILGDRSTVT